jgi:hypothetical protein
MLDRLDWWPSILEFELYDGGTSLNQLGQRFRAVTKGFLPYRLQFEGVVSDVEYTKTLLLTVTGDFEGTAQAIFVQEGPVAVTYYDWRICVRKPLLRRWSFLLRPLFVLNHRWVVRCGERGLRRELARRRAANAVPIMLPNVQCAARA